MIELDGRNGEGGGQILRSSLALAMITGKSFRMQHIRGGRQKPGLLRQHLTAVRAAAQICDAEVSGDQLRSSSLTFRPRAVKAGRYTFSVGSAGSAGLVLQTVLPPLLLAKGTSELTLEGGTHNMLSPPYEFLAHSYLPLVARMGPRIQTSLTDYGFYPAGGGAFHVTIEPVSSLAGLHLLEKPSYEHIHIRALGARIPEQVLEREVQYCRQHLQQPLRFSQEMVRSQGPGNVLLAICEGETDCEVFAAFGRRGLSAEKVAAALVAELQQFLNAEVPVGEHLADQLLLPMALAGEGSFRTNVCSSHLVTNMETLSLFLEVPIACKAEADGTFLTELG